MLEDIYQKISKYRKNGWSAIIGFIIVQCVLIYLIINAMHNNDKVIFYLVIYVFISICSSIITFNVKYKNFKKINQLLNEELLPYILRQTNADFQMTDGVFTKEEVIRSLIISRYGSFKSFNIVKGIVNLIPVHFSFISNVISTGQSSYDVFSGTYIRFQTNQIVDGLIQLRDKGRAEKNKKLAVNTHQYKGDIANRFSDIRFYTSQDLLAEKYITEELVKLYLELKKEYKKGFYLAVKDKELVIGIHNRKNLFKFGFFKKVNQEFVDKLLIEFRKLDHIIYEITKYINQYFEN